MLPDEEDWLIQILAEMLADSTITRDSAVLAMTQIIRDAYSAGLRTLDTAIDVDPLLTQTSINTAAKSMSARTGQIWDQMDQQISDTLLAAIKSGKSYDDTMAAVNQLLTGSWGETVDFDNVGNTRHRVKVLPDGTMQWEEHKITRKAHFATDAYADNISRTVVHESWNAAHHDQQRSIGLTKWVYHAVNDAATRPEHLALHGKVIRYDSPEDAMAQAVMEEPNCRCRAGPYWDDPEFDTDPDIYDRQTVRAAEKARDEVEDDSEQAAYMDRVIQTHKPIRDAADHAEIRGLLAAKWGDDILIADTFEKTNLDTIKESLSGINTVSRDFPTSPSAINHMINENSKGSVPAFTRPTLGAENVPISPKSEISFCGTYYYNGNRKEFEKALSSAKNGGLIASADIAAVGTHEFGHAIEVALAYRAGRSVTSHAISTINRATKNLLGRAATEKEKDAMRAAISRYAASDPRETIAEAFADVYHNKSAAQPLSTEIVNLIRAEW